MTKIVTFLKRLKEEVKKNMALFYLITGSFLIPLGFSFMVLGLSHSNYFLYIGWLPIIMGLLVWVKGYQELQKKEAQEREERREERREDRQQRKEDRQQREQDNRQSQKNWENIERLLKDIREELQKSNQNKK